VIFDGHFHSCIHIPNTCLKNHVVCPNQVMPTALVCQAEDYQTKTKSPASLLDNNYFIVRKKKKNLGKTSKCLSEFKQCNSFKTLNWQRCQWLDSWMSSSVSLLLFNFIHPIGEPNETFVTEICSCHHSHHKGDYYKKPLHGGSNFLLQNKSSLQQSSN